MSHARGEVIDLLVPVGTGFNVDGEVLELGPSRLSVEAAAFALVAAGCGADAHLAAAAGRTAPSRMPARAAAHGPAMHTMKVV